MGQYIVAHDLGTSGNKATLYDLNGNLCASNVYEYPTYYPFHNGVEQNADDWWKAVCATTKKLLEISGVTKSEIACVSFSAQMMGCLAVDANGTPLRNMIIWADQRAVKQAEMLEEAVGMESVYKITGHRISPAYSAAKILWIKDNEPEIYKKTYKFLHAKDYIIHKMTGNFVTDYSDASGMNLFDIHKKAWSDEILNAVGISKDLLPNALPSTTIAGRLKADVANEVGMLEGTPVVIGGGDGSCAAAGAGVVNEGKTYNVIGSSSWISCATKQPIMDSEMRTFNWIHLVPDLYTPCGTMQTAAYSVSWLKNTLCEGEVLRAKDSNRSPYELINEEIEKSPPGANQLLFLPYLLGERSPHWNPDAKGTFMGLKMTTSKADIYRSVLEGAGFNLKIILDILNQEIPIEKVTVIGGGAKSKVWLQILSDIWGKTLVLPKYLEEATSFGAAICGGVGIGAFKDFSVIHQFNPAMDEIKPRLEFAEQYRKLYKVFNKTYEALIPVFKELE